MVREMLSLLMIVCVRVCALVRVCMHVCVCACCSEPVEVRCQLLKDLFMHRMYMSVSSAHTKAALDPMGLQLHTVVSLHVGAGVEPGALEEQPML